LRTEIKFKVKSQSTCQDACGTVRTGACGESFVGKLRCKYKSNCSSKKYCICSIRVFCKKNTIQKQVYEKTISFRARSMLVPRVTTTSEHDTPKPRTADKSEHGAPDTADPEPGTPTNPEPDTPEPGAPTTPDPDRPEPGTPTTPESETPDTPEQEDNKTKSKLGKRKKLFQAFRSMLLPGISTTPEPDTPVPGKSTTPDPDTPESGTPDTVEPGNVESKEDNKIKKNERRKSELEKVRKPQKYLYVYILTIVNLFITC
jgi:hypothetical protein